MNERAKLLIKMNEEMRNLNDEELVMSWLTYGIPDDATPTEIEEWANDEEQFKEWEELYEELKRLDEEEE